MAKQVGSRVQGDVYQGLFFWHQASQLLKPSAGVERVDIEHDDAAGVDDVAVFYASPGKTDGVLYITADYYQLKHHVDQRSAYSSDMLIDPSFLGPQAKSSLLQRFYNAYQKLQPTHSCFLLNLVSNWHWEKEDLLATSIRETGSLPEAFFSAGSRSALGGIRTKWQQHLGASEPDFLAFAQCLRFKLNFFGRSDFVNWVFERLENVGLRVPNMSQRANPYDSLVQQFLMSGPNSFTPAELRSLCEKEDLLMPPASEPSVRKLAFRSFLRFAENIAAESDDFVCVAKEFTGRHPRNQDSWEAVSQTIGSFLREPDLCQRLRTQEHAVLLECHGTIALLAGYELSFNSGSQVFPLQKPDRTVWKPTKRLNQGDTWQEHPIIDLDPAADDIAVALCVTRDISTDVKDYLQTNGAPQIKSLVCLEPKAGTGFNSVQDANHAYALAADAVGILKRVRPKPQAKVHLFTSSPNTLLFFLGQFRESLQRLVVYEYDFGTEKHGTYEPSLSFPWQKIIS